MLNNLKNLVAKYRRKNTELEAQAAAQSLSAAGAGLNNKAKSSIAVAICNQKGGCGKTTTAINLSACLAEKGYEILLIDLDPQAHASLGLGIDTDSLKNSTYDVLINNKGLESVIQNTPFINLDIAPTNSLLSGAHLDLADILGRESVLRIALRKLKLIKKYDFIFIDCSPSLNLVTVNALTACDYTIIPIQTHYYSLEGMKELFSTINIVKERLNDNLEILGILAVLFDSRMKINHQLMGQIRDYFGELVFNTVIHNNVKLCEAPIYKKPVHVHAPNSRGARDYWDLSYEFIGNINNKRDRKNAGKEFVTQA